MKTKNKEQLPITVGRFRSEICSLSSYVYPNYELETVRVFSKAAIFENGTIYLSICSFLLKG
jgi:hypothetical protein